jgi:hypothetical protein
MLVGAPLLGAQAFVRVSVGATGSTDFAKDFIVHPIGARQSVAPTAALVVGWRLASGYRVAVEGRYAKGTWEVDEDGFTDDLGGLGTLALAVMADGPIRGALRWEAAVGQLRYRPEAEIGLFADGAPSRWMLGGGLSWSRPVSVALHLVVGARYEFHGFSSDALESAGYTRSQTVHRIGLTLGVERSF